jgi:hypothetical protein
LPVALLGRLDRNSTRLGTLNSAIRSRQWRTISSAVQGPEVTTAQQTRSSPCGPGRANTTASVTRGCERMTASTSYGFTLKPPRLMISFLRAVRVMRPCSSRKPRSPVKYQPSRKLSRVAAGLPKYSAAAKGLCTISSPSAPAGAGAPLSVRTATRTPGSGVPTEAGKRSGWRPPL